jgi:hypothetical protein
LTYNLYRGSLLGLSQGIYDHAALPSLCGFIDGVAGDGSVTVTVPDSSVPVDSYVLAVAQNATGESVYHRRTGGAEIPLALNACP